jgi:hypothetical protein
MFFGKWTYNDNILYSWCHDPQRALSIFFWYASKRIIMGKNYKPFWYWIELDLIIGNHAHKTINLKSLKFYT